MVSAAMAKPQEVSSEAGASEPLPKLLLAFFFVSGAPALIYQIVWQRALFAIYGVNIESVAIVVSVFMLGLGLGSILGGFVSKLRVPLLAVFAATEVATGIYGLFSLRLFHQVALHTAGASLWKTGFLAFMLLGIPTVLMGSTLPLLLAHVVRQLPNVGRATGLLYFANTLGSACACLIAGKFLMRSYGLSGSARIAAMVNLGIGLCVFVEYLRTRTRLIQPKVEIEQVQLSGEKTSLAIPFSLAMGLAAIGGFIALAYEIIWCRVFSFATGTNPKVFPYLLGAYLAGIAAGSLVADRLCNKRFTAKECMFSIGAALFGGNLWALFVAPEFANLSGDMPRLYAIYIGFVFVAFAAALLSILFPLICHLAISANDRAGAKLSYLYFSNIVGSSLGSFIVGFMAFEYFSIRTVSVVLAALGMGLGIFVLIRAGAPVKRLAFFSTVGVVALGAGFWRLSDIYNAMSEVQWVEILENRHEVITVTPAGQIYGGGAYDGMFNVDPVSNLNGITRMYAAMSLHRAPKETLMIGLSSGSWAQVLINDPRVEHMTAIEINPGYLQMIPHHAPVASLLSNPKLNMIIDDGRRWLLANPDARYDFIVMNTTIHWRANSTNLLSQEFMQILHSHLKPGGVFFFNTTASADAELTACTAFPNVVRVANFLAVSDAPMQVDKQQLTQMLINFKIDGKSVIPAPTGPDAQQLLATISKDADRAINHTGHGMFEYGASLCPNVKGARVVTDDNMAVEWEHELAKSTY